MAVTAETFVHKGRTWTRTPVASYQKYAMGVDLGQSQDYTAIAVLDHSITPLDAWDVDERTCKIKQKFEERFDVRHLERLALGMLYPSQIAHVRSLLARPPLSEGDVPVCFDATSNIGAVDIAEAAGLKPIRITFTSGHEATGQGRKWGVPKSLLVSTLDAKLHCGELRFAEELLAAEALKDELVNFQRNLSATGRLLFEHRSGKHDDLIFAIAMPLWWLVSRQRKGFCRASAFHIGYADGPWMNRLGFSSRTKDEGEPAKKLRPIYRRGRR
jgi:hypothetical protein